MFARPGLPSFDYVRAATPDEVVGRLLEHGAAARLRSTASLALLMGGTDLFPRMRDGQVRPRVVLDVKHLPGQCDMRYDGQTGLTIGAAVSLNQVARHIEVQTRYPLLAEAANSVASYQVRSRATLGGNLCNASPAADTAPAVLVLDGRFLLFGPQGEREVRAGEFFLGPGRTAMQTGEFMTGIRFPVPQEQARGRYLKLGRSRAGDLAIAGVALYAFPDPGARSGWRFRIGLASVAPVPLRAHEAEDALAAEPLGKASFALAAGYAAQASRPIDDVRASAAYRKAMVHSLTLRGLQELASAGPGLG